MEHAVIILIIAVSGALLTVARRYRNNDPYHPAYDEVAKRVEARFKNEMDV